jgi:hypothetical protein
MNRVCYLNDRNVSHYIDVGSVAAALSMADSITQCTRVPAHVEREGQVVYDAANPQPVFVRYSK